MSCLQLAVVTSPYRGTCAPNSSIIITIIIIIIIIIIITIIVVVVIIIVIIILFYLHNKDQKHPAINKLSMKAPLNVHMVLCLHAPAGVSLHSMQSAHSTSLSMPGVFLGVHTICMDAPC